MKTVQFIPTKFYLYVISAMNTMGVNRYQKYHILINQSIFITFLFNTLGKNEKISFNVIMKIFISNNIIYFVKYIITILLTFKILQ